MAERNLIESDWMDPFLEFGRTRDLFYYDFQTFLKILDLKKGILFVERVFFKKESLILGIKK